MSNDEEDDESLLRNLRDKHTSNKKKSCREKKKNETIFGEHREREIGYVEQIDEFLGLLRWGEK